MNNRQLDCKNLANVTWDLHLIKLKSPKLYAHFVNYFNAMNYSEVDLGKLYVNVAIKFCFAIGRLHGKLDN